MYSDPLIVIISLCEQDSLTSMTSASIWSKYCLISRCLNFTYPI
eukprot:UN13452